MSWLPDLFPDINLNMTVFNTNTRDRPIIHKVNKNKDKVIWIASATEMEIHTDTHCLAQIFYQYH